MRLKKLQSLIYKGTNVKVFAESMKGFKEYNVDVVGIPKEILNYEVKWVSATTFKRKPIFEVTVREVVK